MRDKMKQLQKTLKNNIGKYTKKCNICNKTFHTSQANALYCSELCRYTGLNTGSVCKLYIRECKICSKLYVARQPHSKTCSDKTCKYTLTNLGKSCKIYYKNCSHCSKFFISRQDSGKFCSDTCCSIYNNQRIKDQKAKKSAEDNKELEIIKQKVRNLIQPVLEITDIGLNYYNIGGFTESLKNNILLRDNYECHVCYCDTKLEVHHIIPRRMGGDHDESNLITLCSSCHRAIEARDIDYAIKKCFYNYLHKSKKDIKSHEYEMIVKKMNYKLEKLFLKIVEETDDKNQKKYAVLKFLDTIINK